MNMEPQEKSLILLVDDVPANLHVLAVALKNDYRIKIATSGEMALEMIAREQPELILMDVMMPGMSGIDVVRLLRQEQTTRDIAVIFVSADATEQTQLEGLELGADDYLIKPVVVPIVKTRVRNVLARKNAERKLRLAAQVFQSSGEAIMITDKSNCIVEVNHAFVELTGYSLEEVKGKDPKLLSAGKTDPEVFRGMWESIRQTGFWQGELWDKGKNGRTYPKYLSISVVKNAYGDPDFHIASFTDMTERKVAEERISSLARRDSLTGLFNRYSLQDGLDQALARAKREKKMMAVMFIDMDKFKLINDTLGHAAGDALLIEVGRRLSAGVRESDLVARWGGDEFIVVLTDVQNEQAAANVANKLLESLGKHYLYGETTMLSSPSIGLAMYPHDAEDVGTLMKNADTAMYHAKNQGRNNVQFFTSAMNKAVVERLQLERDLRLAVEEQQFELHYQPKLDARSSRIVGFEALVRWRHPVRGMVSPGDFIPIAEETGLIMALGDWILDEACRQLKIWRDGGFADVHVAINLSARQLRSPALLSTVVGALERHGIKGEDIELEVTESVAMLDPVACIGQLNALRIIGVKLSIDDFGTGYSSLSYLRIMPVHALKLDQSFVRDIETDRNDAVICKATINLAHTLGLHVVAEGVESDEQRVYLESLECDVFQGYFFSKPVRAEDASAMLAEQPFVDAKLRSHC